MKTLKGISLLFMAATFMISCKQTSNEQKETVTTETTEKVAAAEVAGTIQKATFQVEGMSCAIGCAKVIEGKLAQMEGVKAATVDFESKTATVDFDDAKQSTETIKKTVEEIAKGAYKVENIIVAKEVAMLDQDDKSATKKCCASHKDGKSCGDKKEDGKMKDGCCKDKKDKKATTTKLNII